MTLRAWLLTIMAAAGCGGGGGEGDGGVESTGGETGAPDELDLDGFVDAAEAAYCAWQVRCHGFGAEVRCRDVMHFDRELRMSLLADGAFADAVPLAYLREALEVGRVELDGEKAAACVAHVAARSCDIPWLHPGSEAEVAGAAACAGVFAGRMGKNGPCLRAMECAEASICGFDPSCTDMCCAGACRVLPGPLALGEACGVGSRTCAPDTYCAFDPETFMPTVCTAAVEVGQPCADAACVTGSFCDFNRAVPVCARPRPPGAACFNDFECEQPAICKYDVNFEDAKCFRPVAEGEPCDPEAFTTECVRFDNYCAPGSATCEPLPDNGEPCAGACRGDLWCNDAARCAPVADAGEPCGSQPIGYVRCSGDSDCDFDGASSVCAAPSGDVICPVPKDPLEGN